MSKRMKFFFKVCSGVLGEVLTLFPLVPTARQYPREDIRQARGCPLLALGWGALPCFPHAPCVSLCPHASSRAYCGNLGLEGFKGSGCKPFGGWEQAEAVCSCASCAHTSPNP